MITLISHFYNEEYMLPFWIKYHRNLFDNAILIDYGSTDNSLSIINDMAPNWKVIKTKNLNFQADLVDNEVMEIEKLVPDWKICLNTTEFILPNANLDIILKSSSLDCFSIKQYLVCDKNYQNPKNVKSFIENLNYGNLEAGYGYRFIHRLNSGYKYGVGRHEFFGSYYELNKNIYIGHCRFYPWNETQIKRKLSFKHKIPQYDININRGYQHLYSREQLIEKEKEAKLKSGQINEYNFNKCYTYARSINNE